MVHLEMVYLECQVDWELELELEVVNVKVKDFEQVKVELGESFEFGEGLYMASINLPVRISHHDQNHNDSLLILKF